jgi:hypothetical protein
VHGTQSKVHGMPAAEPLPVWQGQAEG